MTVKLNDFYIIYKNYDYKGRLSINKDSFLHISLQYYNL